MIRPAAISKYLANIYETGELVREATVSILERVQTEGQRRVARKLAGELREQAVISILETTAAAGENPRIRQDAEFISDFDREIKWLEGR